MARRARRLGVVGVVGMAVLVAAGCSSSSKGTATATTTQTTASGSTPTTSAGSSGGGSSVGIAPSVVAAVAHDPLAGAAGSGLTRGVTATSIKFGCVSEVQVFPGAADGLKAYFTRLNASGGVDGRKIVFSGCSDDGLSATNNAALIKNAVEQDQDFAIVDLSTLEAAPGTDYANAQQVPTFSEGFYPGFCGWRWTFGYNGCLVGKGAPNVPTPYAFVGSHAASQLGAKIPSGSKIAALSSSDPTCQATIEEMQTVYKVYGWVPVANQCKIPLVPPADITPYAQPVLATNPYAMEVEVAPAQLAQFVGYVRSQGFKGPIIDPGTSYQPGYLAKQPQFAATLNGEYSNIFFVPLEESTPFNTQMVADMKAVGVTLVNAAAIQTYYMADMFTSMLRAVGQNLNTKTFDQTVNGGSYTYTASMPGGMGSVSWPAAHFVAADCAAGVQMSGTHYNVVNPFKCYTSVPYSS